MLKTVLNIAFIASLGIALIGDTCIKDTKDNKVSVIVLIKQIFCAYWMSITILYGVALIGNLPISMFK